MMDGNAADDDAVTLECHHDDSSVESAVSVGFIASLFHNTNNVDTDTSVYGWNVSFPGLSLQQDTPSSHNNKEEGPHHSTTRHAAEVHAVTLLARPSNKSLRENAFASFLTLVNARLHAYVRRWPAMSSLLQYRIRPTTLLSRLEVLSPSSGVANAAANGTDTKLAVCCWSMAMDLVIENTHDDATKEGGNDNQSSSLPKSRVISVSFSTLGSISQDHSQTKQLNVELDLHVLLSEMIRQASRVVSVMARLVSVKAVPPPPSPNQSVKRTTPPSCGSMPPPPPRRRKLSTVVVSPDLSSSLSPANRAVPSLLLGDSSLSVDQCADIVDTCLTEFEPVPPPTKLVSSQP